MRKSAIVFIVVFLVTGPTVLADDLYPPAWRGEEGSTWQEWDFWTSDRGPMLPDVSNNIYGDPILVVDTPFDWIDDDVFGGEGVWPLSGELDIYIPNRKLPLDHKDIWIQLKWQAADLSQNPAMPDEPIVGIVPFESMEMFRTDIVSRDGWTHTQFGIRIWPNPDAEWITIKGDILVDQVVIDTQCVPEPAMVVLLGLGSAVMTLVRGRRSV